MGSPHAVVLIAYLLLLLAVGAWKTRTVRTQADFSLAGRGLGTTVLAGTLLATWIGTGSVFGNAQKGYQDGLAAFVLPLSSAVGIAVLFLLAARIRRLEHFTIQDILEQRFGVPARLLGTLALLGGYLIIVSYQYRAGAAVLEYLWPDLRSVPDPVSGEAPTSALAICVVAAFVILYTALAGMISVAYTDVANGLLMALGLALALVLVVSSAGGASELLAALPPEDRRLTAYSPARVVSYLLPAFLLILGDANMYQRFFSARDERTARHAVLGMFAGVLLLDWMIIALAVGCAALVAQGVVAPPANPAHAIVHVAFEVLPAGLGALLCATVVAVVVSTADSYLLSPATSLVRDVYQRFLRPAASEAELVTVARGAVVLLGLTALLLAFQASSFFEVALFAYTLYGAAITPPLLAALFWKGATPAGALASMVTGLVTAICWEVHLGDWVVERSGDGPLAEVLAHLDAALPAVCVSVAALVLVSLCTNPRAATAT
ncbi:MAG: sodium:solute symporter [Planctomycetes bacterium]|nr:sodium:solute symporter [Planctomycetota bacterium]